MNLNQFPDGSKLVALGTTSFNKSTGNPATTIRLKTGNRVVKEMTTTITYTPSIYHGMTIFGVFTKTSNTTTTSLELAFDNSLTGKGAGELLVYRIG